MKLYQIIKNKINKGNVRSVKAKKQIIYSIAIKGSNVALSFLLVPLTLNYLDQTKYGIWLTVATFIEWFGFFDIGLDNGFRNKFAEALAAKKYKLARTYVSTVYAGVFLLSALILIVFFVVNPFLNWAKIFNAPSEMFFELNRLMIFVFSAFAARFVLRIIRTVFIADQRPAMAELFLLIGKVFSLTIIYVLILTTDESLLYLGVTFSISPVLVFLIFSLIYFNGKYRLYKPSLKFVQLSSFKSMLNLGVKFFIIKIAVLVIFSTDNMIITQLYSPKEVTPYNISFKYFSVIILGFGIIVQPFWSAFTEAWLKRDVKWIRNIVKKINKIWIIFSIVTILFIAVSKYAYQIWIGDAVQIPFSLSIVMGVYVIARAYGSIYVSFLNGTGKVKIQFYTSIFSAIINIPLSVFFAKYCGLGITGVMLSTIVSISFGFIIAPVQYKKIITNKAVGIWNK